MKGLELNPGTKVVGEATSWSWLRHPSRHGGQPFPALFHRDDATGTLYYQPFDEDCLTFSWDKRDADWEIIPELLSKSSFPATDAKVLNDVSPAFLLKALTMAAHLALLPHRNRDAFERWARRHAMVTLGYDEDTAALCVMRNQEGGGYSTTWVQGAWLGWQASLESSGKLCQKAPTE